MEKRVEIIASGCGMMQSKINEFLKNTEGSLHDIKFFNSDMYHYAALIYTPKKENGNASKER